MAIEFRSFSKTAGFTGTRCAFTVVPRSCRAYTSRAQSMRSMRGETDGTPRSRQRVVPVQRAAAAISAKRAGARPN